MRKLLAALFFVSILFSFGTSQDKGRLSGLAYFDYSYNVARDTAIGGFSNTALSGAKDFQSFQFRRIYFTYDYDISGDFTSRFRLEADESALSSNGKTGVFVKDAFLKWKNVFGQNDLIFGVQPTPAYEVSEAVWGYRSLEKTVMDLRGIVSSRDLGVSLKGKLDGEGMFSYWVMIADGSANKPESDKYKRYFVHLRLKPVKALDITLYGDLNAKAQLNNPYTAKQVSNSTATMAAFVGYVPMDGLKIGVEGALVQTSNGYNTGTALDTKSGLALSFFGIYGLASDLNLLARFDLYDPNTNSNAKADSRNYIIAGLDWKVNDKVSVIPNIQIETYEKSTVRTFDSSVTGRLTVAWIFQ
jgi:hypothetical protein